MIRFFTNFLKDVKFLTGGILLEKYFLTPYSFSKKLIKLTTNDDILVLFWLIFRLS